MPVMRTISLKVPEALYAKLSELARRKGVSRSAVLREALEAFEGGASSFSSKARDLAGSLNGPKDLSTNPEHMAGFGR